MIKMTKQITKLLSEKLKALGFHGPVPGMDSVSWHAEHFEGTRKEISILFEKHKGLTLHVGLTLVSPRIGDVLKTIGLNDMLNLSNDPDQKSNPMRVPEVTTLYCSLSFLMGAWPPKMETMGEAMSKWRNCGERAPEELAEEIFFYLSRQGIAFFELVDSPRKLADILVKLPAFPGRVVSGGPKSSLPILFSSIYYQDAGEKEKAIAVLQEFVTAIDEEAKHIGSHSPQDAERLIDAKVENERVLSWIRNTR